MRARAQERIRVRSDEARASRRADRQIRPAPSGDIRRETLRKARSHGNYDLRSAE